MTAALSELTVEEAAEQAAGNWRKFECFVWHRRNEITDADNWSIMYTHHRDSGLLDQSNASIIEKTLEHFTIGDDADVVFERHFHWAVGHIDGFSIRVYRNGAITEAYRTYRELQERIADYPILDEEDHSNREYDAAVGNIKDTAWRLKNEFDLPDGRTSLTFPMDGRAQLTTGSRTTTFTLSRIGTTKAVAPSEEELREAFEALGYGRVG